MNIKAGLLSGLADHYRIINTDDNKSQNGNNAGS